MVVWSVSVFCHLTWPVKWAEKWYLKLCTTSKPHLQPPPRRSPQTEHTLLPHSWKSTINCVSSKLDTSPSPAHPHGDYYESPQSCVLWPKQATHEDRKVCPTQHGGKWGPGTRSKCVFSLFERAEEAWLQFRVRPKWRSRIKTGALQWRGILRPQLGLFCRRWRQRSPGWWREWHTGFVSQSPHLIHGSVPRSLHPLLFKTPDKQPFVCSLQRWRGASALWELLQNPTWWQRLGGPRSGSRVPGVDGSEPRDLPAAPEVLIWAFIALHPPNECLKLSSFGDKMPFAAQF